MISGLVAINKCCIASPENLVFMCKVDAGIMGQWVLTRVNNSGGRVSNSA